jgi:hypothetical protein
MKEPVLKQFDVTVENKIGVLAEICDLLARNAINIKAISTDSHNGSGLIRLVTNDSQTTSNVLAKAGLKYAMSDILPIKMVDRPGELAKIAKLLAKGRIGIDAIYLLDTDGEHRIVAMKVTDVEKARGILR